METPSDEVRSDEVEKTTETDTETTETTEHTETTEVQQPDATEHAGGEPDGNQEG